MNASLTPLHQLLTSHRPPKQTTFLRSQDTIDWATFRRHTAGLVRHLRDRTEQRWLLVCEETYAFAVGLFAGWHAGKITVLPPNTKVGAVEDSYRPGDGILSDELDLRSVGDVVPPLERTADPDALTPFPPDRVCAELLTSGSTGERKVLEKTVNQFFHDVKSYEPLWGDLLGDAAAISSVSHQHIFGVLFQLLWPLYAGRPIHSEQALYPGDVVEQINRSGAAYLVTSPAPLERLARSGELRELDAELRAVFSGGGTVKRWVARTIQDQVGVVPRSLFGTTETGGIAWRERDSERSSPGWNLLPGVEVSIDEDNRLHVRSPKVSDSLDEWYPTGDSAERTDSGEFRLGERIDRVVKVAENRVSLPEMEDKLRESEFVRDAAVFLYGEANPERRRRELGAVVALTETGRDRLSEAAEEGLQSTLLGVLSPYFERVTLPRHWAFTDELPQDHMSKIQDRRLMAFFEGDCNDPS